MFPSNMHPCTETDETKTYLNDTESRSSRELRPGERLGAGRQAERRNGKARELHGAGRWWGGLDVRRSGAFVAMGTVRRCVRTTTTQLQAKSDRWPQGMTAPSFGFGFFLFVVHVRRGDVGQAQRATSLVRFAQPASTDVCLSRFTDVRMSSEKQNGGKSRFQ